MAALRRLGLGGLAAVITLVLGVRQFESITKDSRLSRCAKELESKLIANLPPHFKFDPNPEQWQLASGAATDLAKNDDMSAATSHIANELTLPVEKVRAEKEKYDKGESDTQLRHEYILSPAFPVLRTNANAAWLTVGDLYYGFDAYALLVRGAKSALATDLTDTALKVGKAAGVITDYLATSAEKLSVNDASVDFVMCKEAMHHFIHPMQGLYQMLRVARRGVLLIEPHDYVVELQYIKNLGIFEFPDNYEQPYNGNSGKGNYVYRVSVREVMKTAWAARLPVVAFRGFHDTYQPKKSRQWYMKDMCFNNEDSGAISHPLIAIWMFQVIPPASTLRELDKDGFKIVYRPRDPYESAPSARLFETVLE